MVLTCLSQGHPGCVAARGRLPPQWDRPPGRGPYCGSGGGARDESVEGFRPRPRIMTAPMTFPARDIPPGDSPPADSGETGTATLDGVLAPLRPTAVQGRPGAIILTRHGEPALSRKCMLTATQYGDWWARYEVGGLLAGQTPPPELMAAAA